MLRWNVGQSTFIFYAAASKMYDKNCLGYSTKELCCVFRIGDLAVHNKINFEFGILMWAGGEWIKGPE